MIMIVFVCGLLIAVAILFIGAEEIRQSRSIIKHKQIQLGQSSIEQREQLQLQWNISLNSTDISSSNNSSKMSKWPRNTLVVVPAIWKEINWTDRSNWPLWLRDGLGLSDNKSRSYYIHLYQRVDPNSKYPYDWPYCQNVHEETGVYLQFIHDYYYELPDKMLFMHGNPFTHTNKRNPIESAQCVRDDVHFASVNDEREWVSKRFWAYWPRDPNDGMPFMYNCAKRILRFFGYDGELQLNPLKLKLKDLNYISAFCCSQFYVTKERIHRYSYKQWLSAYDANLEPFCTTSRENETMNRRIQWYGGAFEHLWHVILGLYPVDASETKVNTNTRRCQWFRPSCKRSPCTSPLSES